jgi:hypothetical protein
MHAVGLLVFDQMDELDLAGPLDDLGTHTWINWRNYLNKFAPQLFH